MGLPSDSFVLSSWGTSRDERLVCCRNRWPRLKAQEFNGLGPPLIGVFTAQKPNGIWPTAAGWLCGTEEPEWGWNHSSNFFWEGRSQSFFKFGLVCILSSLRTGFSEVVAELGLYSPCLELAEKALVSKLLLFSFPHLCYWLSLWPWVRQFSHWSQWELNRVLCFFMSQIPFLQNEDHNT